MEIPCPPKQCDMQLYLTKIDMICSTVPKNDILCNSLLIRYAIPQCIAEYTTMHCQICNDLLSNIPQCVAKYTTMYCQ